MSLEITQILRRYDGDPAELSRRLIPLVYDTLRAMARARIRKEPTALTLQATALVHDAYLRLFGGRQTWENRRHFFGAAAEAMRRILVEHARHRHRIRHGGDQRRVTLTPAMLAEDPVSHETLMLDEALKRLEAHDPRKALVVKLRYFCGFSIAESAEALEVSHSTVKLDWQYARAWLHRDMAARPAVLPAGDDA